MEGQKFDSDKLRFDLITTQIETELAKVLTMGAAKYAPNSWQQVLDPTNRYYGALRRHLNAWRSGETTDPESGLSHLTHAAANIMFLLHFEEDKFEMVIQDNLSNLESVNIKIEEESKCQKSKPITTQKSLYYDRPITQECSPSRPSILHRKRWPTNLGSSSLLVVACVGLYLTPVMGVSSNIVLLLFCFVGLVGAFSLK